MMEEKYNIKQLDKKRFNLREKIRKYYKQGKDAYDLVVEFHNIIEKLNELGCKAEVKSDYLHIEYWDNFRRNNGITTEVKPIMVNNPHPADKPIEVKDKKDLFSLYLAWTEVNTYKTPIQIQKVKDYFNELNLPLDGEDVKVIDDNHTEYILRYNFEGTEESFRMLKLCTQFVLDTFAKSDFDKFNIAVYGKKKRY